MTIEHNLKRLNRKTALRLESIRNRCEGVIAGTESAEHARLFVDVEYLLLVIGGEFEPNGARQDVIEPPCRYAI